MASPFEIYWRFAGLPLSKAKGLLVDLIPFSVVEFAVWSGMAATLLFCIGWLPQARGTILRKARPIFAALGPVFLVLLGCGQGAFAFSFSPTAWRQPLHERVAADSLPYAVFKARVSERAERLETHLTREDYYSLDENKVMAACDQSLDRVLGDLGLPSGRRVTAIKTMGPLSTLMGLSYGGPAFHDPFFGELAIVDSSDLPTSHNWRLLAACHETAHAKGFTREMDAEILTYLALLRSGDPRLRALADIQFLRKSGEEIAWPELLTEELQRVRAKRKAVEARQPLVRSLKKWAKRLNIRNEDAKYGQRSPEEDWNPHHPFYATVFALERQAETASP